jgi:hypothetical protein
LEEFEQAEEALLEFGFFAGDHFVVHADRGHGWAVV